MSDAIFTYFCSVAKQEMPKEMVDMLKKRRTLKGSWWHMASNDWKFEVWSCKCHEAYHWWHWEEQFRISLFSRTHTYACINLLDFTISWGSQSFRATESYRVHGNPIVHLAFRVQSLHLITMVRSLRRWCHWPARYQKGTRAGSKVAFMPQHEWSS